MTYLGERKCPLPVYRAVYRPPAATRKQYCTCVKSKCTKRCSYAAAGVNCVAACKCSAKPNKCARVLESESDDDE